MSKLLDFQSKRHREKHNEDILERMKSGESLQRYSAQDSWYPPRPVIKKDRNAISMIYKKCESTDGFKNKP